MEDFGGLQECSEPADFQSYISSINEKFDLLLDTVKFFSSLEQADKSGVVDKFKGSLHCEVCLATLLKFSPNSPSSSYQVTCVIFKLATLRS